MYTDHKNAKQTTYNADPTDLADDQLDVADANLIWTTSVLGAETTFLINEATGRKNLAALIGFDKTTRSTSPATLPPSKGLRTFPAM